MNLTDLLEQLKELFMHINVGALNKSLIQNIFYIE